MEFDIGTIIPYILGGGGVVYLIVKHYLDKNVRKETRTEEKATFNADQVKEKIDTLNEKIETLTDEKLNLSVTVARLEERILLNAKNKVKKKYIDLDDNFIIE